jgi:benzoyl-CoA reductase/2-hydroxyglutaryl-CoA dehydratase subunit BcrC/BadD/HgdB
VYDLAKGVPSPASGADLTNFGFVLPLMFGTQAAVRVAGAFRDHYRARQLAGTSGVPGERLRLMWLQNRIQFKEPLVRMLENEYKAAIIVDELNDIRWDPIDPEDPLPGLARRMISIPFTRTAEQRVAHLRRLAEAYRVDGVINPCHWGCRQGTGARGLVTEGLKQIGVPVLNLEVDCADPRNFAEGQLKTRVEAFVEMLSSRPRPW